MDYKQAGVDIDKGDSLVPTYRSLAASTRIPGVLGSLGGFASLFDPRAAGFRDPLLVSGTDGVGTKLLLARQLGRHDTVGIDLVAMCVNDVITCGARPLFFLDYYACGQLDTALTAQVVTGIAEGCRRAGCALAGGETGEYPGMYPPGEYDLAGYVLGAVEREQLVDGTAIRKGDRVLGIASSGFHSNGYSLLRAIVDRVGLDLTASYGLDRPLGEALLEPTLIYAPVVQALCEKTEVHGLAHITGGGLPGNANRILPGQLDMRITKDSWTRPPLFALFQEQGDIPEAEMYRTFNMGVGMVVVLPPSLQDQALQIIQEHDLQGFAIGEIVDGGGKVVLA